VESPEPLRFPIARPLVSPDILTSITISDSEDGSSPAESQIIPVRRRGPLLPPPIESDEDLSDESSSDSEDDYEARLAVFG